jgi:putative intracellular protease/amidase
MQSICFGDGKFVAVGSGGVIHTSSDGQLWDDGRRPVLFTLNRVIYANGTFVAVGNQGTIITSTNGFNWIPQVSGTTNDLLAVTFGNGLYVAAGTAGQLAISTDGISWSSASAGAGDLDWITFGNGLFVLPTPNLATSVQVSSDGQSWVMEAIPAPINYQYPHHLFQVEFGNGLFLAIIQDEIHYNFTYQPVGHLYQSSDGTNWVQGAQGGPSSSASHRFLSFANGSFYEFDGAILSASNANAYVQNPAPNDAPDAKYMAYGNGRYVLIEENGKTWTSTDATNWASGYNGFRSDVFQIIAGANNYVALASLQPILVSPDGLNFIAISNSPVFNGDEGPVYGIFDAVAFDGTNYVAVGGGSSFLGLLPPPGTTGFVYTSTNSIDWVSRTANDNQPLTAICRGPTRWVAVGQNGAVISSPNTLAWTLRASGTANTLNSVAFGNGSFVAVGNGGTIVSSPDGATWDVQYSGTTSSLNCVRYADGQFWAVGQGGTILTSPDGDTWGAVVSSTTATFTLNSIAYGDGRFVICGTGVVLASTNGVNWQDI